jgi:hypothetical protein
MTAAASAPGYVDCSGWPEPRVYVEAQQWFTPPGVDIDTQDDSKHTHIVRAGEGGPQ